MKGYELWNQIITFGKSNQKLLEKVIKNMEKEIK